MKAKIYYKNQRIIKWEKTKKENRAILENGESYKKCELKKPSFEIECEKCGNRNTINYYYNCDDKPYVCVSCRSKGKNNPFYNKKHNEKTKKIISNKATGRKGYWKGKKLTGKYLENIKAAAKKRAQSGIYVGKNNPFYGKKHPKELQEKITKNTIKAKSKWSEARKQKYSETQSKAQKRLLQKNEIDYRRKRSKAAKASHLSQQRKYQKNKIEIKVEKEFEKMNLFPKYSVILGYFQFDFGFKDERILLEVQGDYWHGNPNLFNEDGTNDKRKLNQIQKNKIIRDSEKKSFALDNGLKIYYIWEEEINKGNFSVLKEIKNEIQIIRANDKNNNI